MDLGQNITRKLFYPGVAIYLQKVVRVPEAALQFSHMQAGEESLVPQEYNMIRNITPK